jgi:hypothetical protein
MSGPKDVKTDKKMEQIGPEVVNFSAKTMCGYPNI